MMEMIWLPGGLQSLLTKPGKKAKINMMKQRAVGKCSPGLPQSRRFRRRISRQSPILEDTEKVLLYRNLIQYIVLDFCI